MLADWDHRMRLFFVSCYWVGFLSVSYRASALPEKPWAILYWMPHLADGNHAVLFYKVYCINRNAGRRTSCAGAHQSRGGDHSSKHSSTPKLVNTTAVAFTRSTTVRRAPIPRLSVLGIHREQSARFSTYLYNWYSKQAMTGRSMGGMWPPHQEAHAG